MKSKRITPYLTVVLVLQLIAGQAGAVSSDIVTFSTSGGAPPNILVTLDTSGSMGGEPDNCKNFDPNNPCLDPRDKKVQAREAIRVLVETVNPPDGSGGYVENARFGVMKFNAEKVTDDELAALPAPNTGLGLKGGQLWFPIASGNTGHIIAFAEATKTPKFDGIPQAGGTILGNQLVDAGRYFMGENQWGELPLFGQLFGDVAATTLEPFDPVDPTAPLPGTPRYKADTQRLPWDGKSPIDLACRQNFIIFMSDGNDKSSRPDKYGPTAADPLNPSAAFCSLIGDADGDGDPANKETKHEITCGAGSNWMDDVAYVMNRTDFAPGLPGMQNIIVHTIGFDSDPRVLEDGAANGGGTYQTANSAATLAQAFLNATQTIFDGLVSFTGATVPSSRTAFSDALFNAYFHANSEDAFWPGHIEAYRLSPTLEILDRNGNPALDAATGTFVDPPLPFWDVANRLSDANRPARTLLTAMGGVRTAFTEANIAAADLNLTAADLLNYDPAVYPDVETLADGFVRYIDGQDAFDEDGDANLVELRDDVLGDVFHSAPLVIGPPPGALSAEDGYGPYDQPLTFMNIYKQRKRRLYVGANDGMLHAINAGTFRIGDNPATPEVENNYYDMGSGDEMFGYTPGVLLKTLKQIPQNIPRNYYYVDGSPSATDAWFASGPADTTKEPVEWTTVMVTGLREGGAGYFALDVTDPDATVGAHGPYPKLLWEFADPAEPLGQAWSEPILTRVKVEGSTGSGDNCGLDDGDGDCREQWVAIFGGGYTVAGDGNTLAYISDPADPAWSNDGKAVFIVALDTGAILARLEYDGADAQLAQMTHTLASTPAVLDVDFDGFSDLVVIGDTGGQLWKWDLSLVGIDSDLDTLVDNWPAGVFFRSDPIALGGGKFHYHSIFFPPSASFVNGKLVYSFGTGERNDLQFVGTAGVDDNNRFFVVQDPDPTGALAIPAAPYTEADITNVTGLGTDPDLTDQGFYYVVPDGEKFVTNHVSFGGFLITTTYDPTVAAAAAGPCSSGGGGASSLFVFDLELGGGFFSAVISTDQGRKLDIGAGVAGDPRIVLSDGKAMIFVKTSKGQIITTDAPDVSGEPVELIYWRQRF